MMNFPADANDKLIELADSIINSANEYYEVANPDEEVPRILEDIVLSTSSMLSILKKNNIFGVTKGNSK